MVDKHRCLYLLHLSITFDDVLMISDQKAARHMGSLMLESGLFGDMCRLEVRN